MSPSSYFKCAPPPAIYTLSLHDALPIWWTTKGSDAAMTANAARIFAGRPTKKTFICGTARETSAKAPSVTTRASRTGAARSEEHTSELQSHSDLVCRLLLEKKKKKTKEQ